jgi:hypothetical protein
MIRDQAIHQTTPGENFLLPIAEAVAISGEITANVEQGTPNDEVSPLEWLPCGPGGPALPGVSPALLLITPTITAVTPKP